MNLAHLFKIVGTDDEVTSRLAISETRDWDAVWKPVNALRTRIAHAVRPVLESRHELDTLIQVDRSIHRLLSALT
jgi:hypothetical protein